MTPRSISHWFQTGTVSIRSNSSCNVLVAAPHGHPADDVSTELLGYRIAEKLDAYALINNRKYRRPKNNEQPNPKGGVVDLNRPSQAKHCRNDYWTPMLRMIRESNERFTKPPIVLFVHGMKDSTAEQAVGTRIGDPHAVWALGAGYEIDYRASDEVERRSEAAVRYARAKSASDGFISELLSLLRVHLGPGGDGIPGFGAVKSLPSVLRQESGVILEAVQLEVRWTGFRDSADNVERAAEKLTAVFERLKAVERFTPDI